MESTLSSYSVSYWNYLTLYFLRPLLAVTFVFSLILLGWFFAWKLVLVHVPLVQEIFGLRKTPVKPKPATRGRLSRFYNSVDSRNMASECMGASKEAITHCHFHPTEVIVGVCSLCVKERLLILASEQAHLNLIKSIHKARKGPPKAFAFSSFPKHHHPKLRRHSSDDARKNAFPDNEEVFISIKFGDDGNRLRKKGASSRPSLEVCNPTSTYCFNKARRRSMSIAEHTRPTRTIWWRKRVDHLLELMLGKIQV